MIYRVAFWASFAWFAYWLYRGAADGVQYWAAVPYILLAAAPLVALTIVLRIVNGRQP